MNLSKTKTIISVAVVSMVGAAGYAYAQQTGAQQSDSSSTYRDGTSAGANNPAGVNNAAEPNNRPGAANTPEGGYSARASNANVPSARVSGAVGETSGSSGTTDSTRMNSSASGERLARADRN